MGVEVGVVAATVAAAGAAAAAAAAGEKNGFGDAEVGVVAGAVMQRGVSVLLLQVHVASAVHDLPNALCVTGHDGRG